jgi:hypothetical protein
VLYDLAREEGVTHLQFRVEGASESGRNDGAEQMFFDGQTDGVYGIFAAGAVRHQESPVSIELAVTRPPEFGGTGIERGAGCDQHRELAPVARDY